MKVVLLKPPRILQKNVCKIAFFCSLALSFTSFKLNGQSLQDQQEALDIISNFADKLCKEVPLSGKQSTLTIEGEATMELNGMVKRFADLGFEGAVKYNSEEYAGILRTDLAKVIELNKECRITIWNDLNNKLVRRRCLSVLERDNALKTVSDLQRSNHLSQEKLSSLEEERKKLQNELDIYLRSKKAFVEQNEHQEQVIIQAWDPPKPTDFRNHTKQQRIRDQEFQKQLQRLRKEVGDFFRKIEAMQNHLSELDSEIEDLQFEREIRNIRVKQLRNGLQSLGC